jgi:hypothetical protein
MHEEKIIGKLLLHLSPQIHATQQTSGQGAFHGFVEEKQEKTRVYYKIDR